MDKLFISVLAVGLNSTGSDLTWWFGGNGTINVTLPNFTSKFIYKPKFIVREYGDVNNTKRVIVGRVLLGRGCVNGVRIYDLNGTTLAFVRIAKEGQCIELKKGEVIIVYTPLTLSKFGGIEFIGQSNIHSINVWMTQVR